MSDQRKRLLAKSIYSTVQQKSLESMIKRELVLNYRMTAFLYINNISIINVGPVIIIFFGNICKGKQTVHLCH